MTADQSVRNVVIRSAGVLSLADHALTVAGNWTNYGTFNSDTGTVIMSGTFNRILGENTFYNFIKAAVVDSTLEFDAVATTTVTGELSLSGTSSHALVLKGAANAAPVYSSQFGTSGSGDGQFNKPHGIAIDSHGNIYVADTKNNRIQKFDSAGNFIRKWGSLGTGAGQFTSPQKIVIDSADHIWVGETRSRIQKFDSDGNFLEMWGRGVLDGSAQFQICSSSCHVAIEYGTEPFGSPYSLAFNSRGEVYVPDWEDWYMYKFSATGTYLGRVSADVLFDDPGDIAIDSNDNMYVLNRNDYNVTVGRTKDTVVKFNSSDAVVGGWGTLGTDIGEFPYAPHGIAIGPDGYLYIADTGNESYPDSDGSDIQKFDTDGNFIARWGGFGSGDGQFKQPHDIAFDAAGNYYVIEQSNSRVQKFSPATDVTWGIDVRGTSTVSHLSVLNSHNNGSLVICAEGCSDGTGNSGWLFVPPTVTTGAANSIGATAATLNGYLVNTGGENASARGFAYGTSTTYGATTTESGSYEAGAFAASVSDLVCGVTYHFAAFAINSVGTSSGSDAAFSNNCPQVSGGRRHAEGGGGGSPSVISPQSSESIGTIDAQPTIPTTISIPSAGATYVFTKSLNLSSKGEEVVILQKYLNDHGYSVASSGPGSPRNESSYFGTRTQAALARFQKANNIFPAAGYFGPITRSFIARSK